LRLALERKELFLEYQPQMDIATGNIIGAEALLRWRHPELGLISPGRFIPIAENSGLIIPIGEWALRTACAQARLWQDEGLPLLTVAVNVSVVQFRQESFVQSVKKVLQETGLSPQYLELELTERLLLPHSDVVLVLQELTEEGVKLSIDDFGTGYSSLSYLRHFPIYKLKIDRSFVQDLGVASDAAVITATIINMAKSLNLKVIAEGVESEEQLSFLRTKNCDEAQGYYFSKPIAGGALAEFLRSKPLLQSDWQTTTPLYIGEHQGKLEWAREALSRSGHNSRITMEILLLNDKLLIDPLLIERAENARRISELISTLEGKSTSEKEKQLLAAVNRSRAPYVASYLKALHLHLAEDKQEAARVIMLEETAPAWLKYHNAWKAIVQYQIEEIYKATNQSRSLASELVPLPD
jgi:EAL domain-containing protein (putative c-di-GMP-specific phosphodiesterase class I)